VKLTTGHCVTVHRIFSVYRTAGERENLRYHGIRIGRVPAILLARTSIEPPIPNPGTTDGLLDHSVFDGDRRS